MWKFDALNLMAASKALDDTKDDAYNIEWLLNDWKMAVVMIACA